MLQGTVNTVVGTYIVYTYLKGEKEGPRYLFALSVLLLFCGFVMLIDFFNYAFVDNYIKQKRLRNQRAARNKPMTY